MLLGWGCMHYSRVRLPGAPIDRVDPWHVAAERATRIPQPPLTHLNIKRRKEYAQALHHISTGMSASCRQGRRAGHLHCTALHCPARGGITSNGAGESLPAAGCCSASFSERDPDPSSSLPPNRRDSASPVLSPSSFLIHPIQLVRIKVPSLVVIRVSLVEFYKALAYFYFSTFR